MRPKCLLPSLRAPIIALLSVLLFSACFHSGPVRRISAPTASIQQLTVALDGQWSVQLRLQNFSSIPMRFVDVELSLHMGEQPAGQLLAQADLVIGPESADVLTLALHPAANARMALADALARGRSIAYQMEGTLAASPHDRDKPRRYESGHHGILTPVPGLAGVLR